MHSSQSKRNRLECGHLRVLAGLLAFSLSSAPAFAKNYDYSDTQMTQKDAGGLASNNYWNGSGDSKDEGVRNYYRAMNRVAALDIGGAFHYGYKGYDNYINSQRMDDLDSAVWAKKGTLDSDAAGLLSGASGVTGASGSGDYQGMSGPESQGARLPSGSVPSGNSSNGASSITKSHMLSDMDKGFLYRGETGEVAAEFEKKSGMSRETAFNELAAAEASGLSWDDPNLMAKMEGRYKNFIKQIPNKEYRENIEKMHDMFNMAKKLQVFEEAANFYKSHRYGDGGDKLAKAAADAAGKGSQGNATGDGGASRDPASLADAPAAVQAVAKLTEDKPKLSKEQMGLYLGLEGTHGDELKDFVGQEDTIFHVVSKRYRKLTPMMLGRLL